MRDLLSWNACGKSGARDRASKEFARINAALSLEEKIRKIARAPYMHMGLPELFPDGTLLVHAVPFAYEGRYACACANFRRLKRDYPVSKSYCFCCGGHFQYHYQIMPGANPCAFSFDILDM